MIIVSQEKDATLNFENIIAIRMSIDIETNKRNIIAIDTIDNERYYIAKYETEERAKKVLQEIRQCFYNTEILKYANNQLDVIALNKLQENALEYEMPAE